MGRVRVKVMVNPKPNTNPNSYPNPVVFPQSSMINYLVAIRPKEFECCNRVRICDH